MSGLGQFTACRWIDVDWNVIIGRRGVRYMTQQAHFVQLYIEITTCTSVSWSVDETRALLDMYGANKPKLIS